MLFRHEWNCAVELRHLRYFLAVGEALKTPASAVPEKRARAYPCDPISAGSHYPLQLQEARDQPPRAPSPAAGMLAAQRPRSAATRTGAFPGGGVEMTVVDIFTFLNSHF